MTAYRRPGVTGEAKEEVGLPIRTTFGAQMVQMTLTDVLAPALLPQEGQEEPAEAVAEGEVFRRFQEFMKWRRVEQGFLGSQIPLDDLPAEYKGMVPGWSQAGKIELKTYGQKKNQKTFLYLSLEFVLRFGQEELPEILARFRAACEDVSFERMLSIRTDFELAVDAEMSRDIWDESLRWTAEHVSAEELAKHRKGRNPKWRQGVDDPDGLLDEVAASTDPGRIRELLKARVPALKSFVHVNDYDLAVLAASGTPKEVEVVLRSMVPKEFTTAVRQTRLSKGETAE